MKPWTLIVIRALIAGLLVAESLISTTGCTAATRIGGTINTDGTTTTGQLTIDLSPTKGP